MAKMLYAIVGGDCIRKAAAWSVYNSGLIIGARIKLPKKWSAPTRRRNTCSENLE